MHSKNFSQNSLQVSASSGGGSPVVCVDVWSVVAVPPPLPLKVPSEIAPDVVGESLVALVAVDTPAVTSPLELLAVSAPSGLEGGQAVSSSVPSLAARERVRRLSASIIPTMPHQPEGVQPFSPSALRFAGGENGREQFERRALYSGRREVRDLTAGSGVKRSKADLHATHYAHAHARAPLMVAVCPMSLSQAGRDRCLRNLNWDPGRGFA